MAPQIRKGMTIDPALSHLARHRRRKVQRTPKGRREVSERHAQYLCLIFTGFKYLSLKRTAKNCPSAACGRSPSLPSIQHFFCWMGTYLHQLTLGDLHLLIFNAIDLLFLVRVDTEPC